MKTIQFSPKKMIEDATIIWPWMTEDVQMVMDPRSPLSFILAPNQIKAIYCFNLLGITDEKNILPMIKNFYNILANNGELYIVEPNLDYIARALVGGDIKISDFNRDFTRQCYFNQDYISNILRDAGFPEDKHVVWLDPKVLPFQHFEIAISAKKIIK